MNLLNLEIYSRAFELSEFDELIKLLENNNIPFKTEETKDTVDPLQVRYNSGYRFFLRVDPLDKVRIDELVSNNLIITYRDIPEGYYLLNYTNDELLEIIVFKDQWSVHDFKAAEAILKERGIKTDQLSPELIAGIKLKNEAEKEPSPKMWLAAGYLFALVGGLIGFIVGISMWLSKRTLSDGSKMYEFEEKDRRHGMYITLIGIVMSIFWCVFFFKRMHS